MSRERPSEPPRAVPDAQRGRDLKPHQLREREQLERLKRDSGAGVFGNFVASITDHAAPRFVRPGYLPRMLDELDDFYAARPRPWRPASRDSCKPTFKERLKAKRRAAQ